MNISLPANGVQPKPFLIFQLHFAIYHIKCCSATYKIVSSMGLGGNDRRAQSKGLSPMKTLHLSLAQRAFSFAAAVIIALAMFGGPAVTAQARSGSFYTATLATAVDTQRAVAGSLVWNCTGTTCVAPRGTSRPAIVCARFVREVGRVTGFTANGEALDAAALERCNAAA
jgi:hypothetical protein